jgi:hypothetical protein
MRCTFMRIGACRLSGATGPVETLGGDCRYPALAGGSSKHARPERRWAAGYPDRQNPC